MRNNSWQRIITVGFILLEFGKYSNTPLKLFGVPGADGNFYYTSSECASASPDNESIPRNFPMKTLSRNDILSGVIPATFQLK